MVKKIQVRGRSRLRAKLSLDDGFAERPIYSIKAFTNEKDKGINMINLIEDNFGITLEDKLEAGRKEFEEMNRDMDEMEKKVEDIDKSRFSKDEKGNFISPFSKKAKELKEANS